MYDHAKDLMDGSLCICTDQLVLAEQKKEPCKIDKEALPHQIPACALELESIPTPSWATEGIGHRSRGRSFYEQVLPAASVSRDGLHAPPCVSGAFLH